MNSKVLGVLLLLTLLVVAVAAKNTVVFEPNAKSILSESYSSFKAEYGECVRNRQQVYHLLTGEKALNNKNTGEIEMIKRLLAMMRVGVHKRHAEKEPLIKLLTKLLNRLLGIRADNLARIAPLQRKYNTLKRHCKDKKKDHDENKNALKEIKLVIANQKKLVSDNKSCVGGKKACAARKAKLSKALKATQKKLKALIKKYNKLVVDRAHCAKSLTDKKNKVANERANNGKTTQDIKNIKAVHATCSKNVKSTDNKHDNCDAIRKTCNAKKAALTGDLQTLQKIGDSCTATLQKCQQARLVHSTKCKATTAAAQGLERSLGSCQNEEEHCQAKLATNGAELPKCQKDLKTIRDGLAKLTKAHADIAKELLTYKPPVRPNPVVLPDFKPKYPTPSSTKIKCYSTGDPHYRNFAGQAFNMYGWYGNFVLARVPGAFEVETNVRPNPPVWRNRGLNTDVGVRLGNNVLYGRYNRYVLNGKTLNLGVGQTMKLADGSSIRRTSSTHYMAMHSSGAFVNIHGASSRGFIYHNIYVYLPSNWVAHAEGLCKAQSARTTLTSAFLSSQAVRSTSDPRHLIGKSVASVVIPKGHPFNNIAWKSTQLRDSAMAYCGQTLKLQGSQYVDCLLDAKVVGSITGATTYKGVAQDLATSEHLTKIESSSAAGHTLREVARLKNLLEASSKRLLVLGNHLTNYHSKTLAADVGRLSTRLAAEHKFLNQLQGDFTAEVLKR